MALALSISMVPTMAVAGPSSSRGLMAAPAGAGVTAAVPGALDHALMLVKKRKKKKKKSSKPSGGLTPEAGEAKREALRAGVAEDVEAERWKEAADRTESGAAEAGDPLSFKDAAEYRLEQAKAERDVDVAHEAIETANITLDILYFYDAVDEEETHSDYRPIEPAMASSLVSEVQGIIEQAEELIEEIEAEEAAAAADGAGAAGKTKKQRTKKPGVALIAIGSGFSAIGVAGMSLGLAGLIISSGKQKEVEGLTLPQDQALVDQLDEEGSRANLLGFIGLGVAAGGLAIGVPLIVVGVLKRKKAGNPPESARLNRELRVVPTMSRRSGGMALQGRF